MTDDLDIGSDDDSGGGGGKSLPTADPLDFGAIEAAVNEAAKRLNAVWVTFILLMTYLFIATGKITHKDLFLETPVKLPVLGVDVPLLGYFIAAPLFILAVHFYFLIQLRDLAAKFGEYDAVFSERPEAERGKVGRLRQRIDNSLFAQILGGPRSTGSFFLRWVAVLTTAVLPIALLLFVQLTFLAYQGWSITIYHRVFLGLDAVFALFVGIYVARIASTLKARRPSEPKGKEQKGWLRILHVFSASGRSPLTWFLVLVLWVAWYIAVLPSEPREFAAITRAVLQADPDPVRQGPSSWFSNRLVLPDQNLIEGFDLDKVNVTRSLRGRQFVNAIFDRADLRQADFTGANLRFASLQGAKLVKAQFGCAFSGSWFSSCTQLQQAHLDSAEMQNAEFFGANMMGASFNYARLDGASLAQTQLQGASLSGARLEAADLSSAGMDGASLSDARLTATVLSYSSLRGADCTNAWMVGAVLDGALAQNASFEGAEMQGASMRSANFGRAKFQKTAIYATDVSGSLFKGALIKEMSNSRTWKLDYGYSSYYPDLFVEGDPFGKEGDVHKNSFSGGSADVYAPAAPIEIPAAEQDRLTTLFANGLPQDPMGTEIKKRLARLTPDSKTVDWKKLADQSSTETEYLAGLGERLIVIACAKAGEGHVARGLIRSRRLCPYKKEVEVVLNSGLMPNGKACADAEDFKRIWIEAVQTSTVCEQNAGRPSP